MLVYDNLIQWISSEDQVPEDNMGAIWYSTDDNFGIVVGFYCENDNEVLIDGEYYDISEFPYWYPIPDNFPEV